MNKEAWVETGRKGLWFFAQLVALVLCIGYIEFIYYQNILPDKLVDDDFNQTTCTLTYKTLESVGTLVHRYRANFVVSYIVNNGQYNSMTSANGLDRSYTTDRRSQESALNEFNVGSSYPCWYDPSAPQIVVLVLRHRWSSTFPLFIPSVIAIIMVYYLMRSIFSMTGTVARKTKERKQKKSQQKETKYEKRN